MITSISREEAFLRVCNAMSALGVIIPVLISHAPSLVPVPVQVQVQVQVGALVLDRGQVPARAARIRPLENPASLGTVNPASLAMERAANQDGIQASLASQVIIHPVPRAKITTVDMEANTVNMDLDLALVTTQAVQARVLANPASLVMANPASLVMANRAREADIPTVPRLPPAVNTRAAQVVLAWDLVHLVPQAAHIHPPAVQNTLEVEAVMAQVQVPAQAAHIRSLENLVSPGTVNPASPAMEGRARAAGTPPVPRLPLTVNTRVAQVVLARDPVQAPARAQVLVLINLMSLAMVNLANRTAANLASRAPIPPVPPAETLVTTV